MAVLPLPMPVRRTAAASASPVLIQLAATLKAIFTRKAPTATRVAIRAIAHRGRAAPSQPLLRPPGRLRLPLPAPMVALPVMVSLPRVAARLPAFLLEHLAPVLLCRTRTRKPKLSRTAVPRLRRTIRYAPEMAPARRSRQRPSRTTAADNLGKLAPPAPLPAPRKSRRLPRRASALKIRLFSFAKAA